MARPLALFVVAGLVLVPAVIAGVVFSVPWGIVTGFLVLAFFVAVRLLGAWRTLSAVNLAASQLAAGNYQARVDSDAPLEVRRVVDSFNETAQRVQAQMAAASEGRSRLMAALDSSVDPVVALDSESKVVFANLAAEGLFGIDVRAIVGRPFAWLLADEKVIEAVRQSREGQSQASIDIERPGRRYMQVVATPIAGGGEWAVLVVIHDVSDVKRTEQVRRDFVANVSHELRTPLAGIKAVIETLAEGAIEDRAAAMDFLNRADSEVDRLIILVEELLELSRIESGELPLTPRPTSINTLLADVVERLRPQAERKHLHLILEPLADDATVILDPERMERGLVNLVHNAIKFTPDGGSVSVSAAVSEAEVIFTVRDTGIGIGSEELPRVFERFYKAEQSRAGRTGSGIGLAIVRHTVEAHGGSVSVESRLAEGSTFTVRLPRPLLPS